MATLLPVSCFYSTRTVANSQLVEEYICVGAPNLPNLILSTGAEIPEAEFQFSFARSGGPGGQNVNKVNSKAIMHWDIKSSPSVTAGVKRRFAEKYPTRLTSEGLVVISSQKTRDQIGNVQDCIDKLAELLETVLIPPILRKPTKIPKSVKIARTESKRETGKKKQQRKSVDYDY